MNAVAPQTVSSSSSKKCSSRSVGLRPQRSAWYVSGRTSSASGSQRHPLDLRRWPGASGTTSGRRPTTGTMWLRLTTVLRWSSSANSVTSDGSRPTSSWASRSAVSDGRLARDPCARPGS